MKGFLLACLFLLWPACAVSQEQDCTPKSDLGSQCLSYIAAMTPPSCLRPGLVFVKKQQWESASRTTIPYAERQKHVDFFYVVDARNSRRKYEVLFVGIDRVFGQRVRDSVKLSQNREFNFKDFEKKKNYSQALKPRGYLSQNMRRWGKLPSIESIYARELDAIPKFDFPRALDQPNHIPHARLYRFETGKVACVAFQAGITADVDAFLGTVVDLHTSGFPSTPFSVTVQR